VGAAWPFCRFERFRLEVFRALADLEAEEEVCFAVLLFLAVLLLAVLLLFEVFLGVVLCALAAGTWSVPAANATRIAVPKLLLQSR